MAREINDLRKLRHVVGVARAGSFTHASGTLAITQSALTKSVAEVEHQLGIALFQRLPRGVRLTQAREEFLPRAERLLENATELMADMGDLQSLVRGHLHIGVTPAAFVAFLEQTVSDFARVYPGIQIEVQDGSADDVVRDLVNGQIDVVICAANTLRSWGSLQTKVVAPLHHYFIARRGHPVAVGSATARELLQYPIVIPRGGATTEAQLRAAYEDAGMSPVPPQYVCDHFALVKNIVAKTDAVSPVVSLDPPRQHYTGEFQVYEDVIDLSQLELGVAYVDERMLAPAARAFIDIFGSFLQDSRE